MMNYFLLYATANDERLHFQDILNLYTISIHKPGVDTIQLYIAISEVKKPNFIDDFFVKKVKKLFNNHPFVQLKEIFYKGNVGRDFSSYANMYTKLASTSNKDYIFFQNRSARGPFEKGWYARYIEQFERYDQVAFCGNTINMFDLSDKDISPHVQSHALMSNASTINKIIDNFPGVNETTRINIITKGEIALSSIFLDKGYKITSLNEPEVRIGKELTKEAESSTNINPEHSVATTLPYYHSGQIRTIKKIKRSVKLPWLMSLKWFFGN